MKAFRCRVCGNALYFENSFCVSCGTSLGYSRTEREKVPVDTDGRYVDAVGTEWWICSNLELSGCTWLALVRGGQCSACDLTRTRPNDGDFVGMERYAEAEQAKRRLVVELDTLGFPLTSRWADPVNGVCFDLLSGSDGDPIITGHDQGVITIDLAESDPVYRAKVREALEEPYRTMLGHFRHEIGHYIEWQYVVGYRIEEARALFGDERTSYADAMQRHYAEGAPANWRDSFLSTYATMHPFEDFAETFAHYLHICDTLESGATHGLITMAPISAFSRFADVVTGVWMPFSTAMNVVSRSMGRGDLYPFVIPPPAIAKLEFVASLNHRGQ